MNARDAQRRPAGVRSPALGLCLAVAICLAGVPWEPARAELLINPKGWKFPNIITSAKEAIRVSDRTPLIPGRETILKGYRKADGTRFMTYEIEGRVFGVEIDENGKPPFEYSILDTDGDGKFETKLLPGPGNTDRAYVPRWVIDYYYGLHPELKNPAVAQTMSPSPPSLVPPDPQQAAGSRKTAPKTGPPPPEVRERPNP